MKPIISITSITIRDSFMEPQECNASSLIPCPMPRASSLFFSFTSPRPANITSPASRAHTMECPVMSMAIIVPIKITNAIISPMT